MPFDGARDTEVVVIGAGQAGLCASYLLKRRGVPHVVLEKHRIAHAWRSERWDSFCLVTPNHQCRLPGHRYRGPEPEGFMVRDEIVRFLEDYAGRFDPPVVEGVTVTSVDKRDGAFHVSTDRGTWRCDDVICAIGSFHTPVLPAGVERVPGDIVQLHSADYRNPRQLPAGATIVVGSGQSGCQIAEDLMLDGREVHLCLGNAPRSPRRYRGKDAVTWLEEMGYYKISIEDHPDQHKALTGTNHYLTGRDGGREIDLRDFARRGLSLYGYVEEIDAGGLRLRRDVVEKLDAADASYNGICRRIDEYIAAAGIDAPPGRHYEPDWAPAEQPTRLDFRERGIRSIVWGIGFRPDFRFIKLPVTNLRGFPETRRGVTAIPGLYFLGLPWMHTWGSARFAGIAEDAEHVVSHLLAARERNDSAVAAAS